MEVKTLLLPVDFSARSLEAARQATAISHHFGSRLILLNVLDRSRRSGLQFEAGGSSAEELRAYLTRQMSGTPIFYLVEDGDPAEVIANRARLAGANLIVISPHSYSRSKASRWVP